MRVFGILFFVLIAVGSYAQDGFKLISKGQGTSIYYGGKRYWFRLLWRW